MIPIGLSGFEKPIGHGEVSAGIQKASSTTGSRMFLEFPLQESSAVTPDTPSPPELGNSMCWLFF